MIDGLIRMIIARIGVAFVEFVNGLSCLCRFLHGWLLALVLS